MNIVAACAGQAPVLSGIAWAAKAHWGYPPEWMEHWRGVLTVRPEQIEAHDFFVALDDDAAPVGFYALLDKDAQCWLEHLWVLPDYIGRGIGRRLFAHAVARVRGQNAAALNIEADPHAEGFYLRMGAVRFGTADGMVSGVKRQLPLLRYELK